MRDVQFYKGTMCCGKNLPEEEEEEDHHLHSTGQSAEAPFQPFSRIWVLFSDLWSRFSTWFSDWRASLPFSIQKQLCILQKQNTSHLLCVKKTTPHCLKHPPPALPSRSHFSSFDTGCNKKSLLQEHLAYLLLKYVLSHISLLIQGNKSRQEQILTFVMKTEVNN